MSEPISDEAFARCLSQIGGASLEQIEAAKAVQAENARKGMLLNLADVLLQQGIITPAMRENVEKKARAAQQGGLKQLGNYKLIKKLGEGGMGAVYLADDTVAQRKVALKVLPQKHSGDTEFLSRFRREARNAGKLSHPNIVAAYTVGEEAGHHFYAMEYCEGEPLDVILKREQRMQWDKALDITLQSAQGLSHAHEFGFIHRDIKPANIFITKEGVAKILDLGLSKNISESEQSFNTQTGAIMGTPHYISPEQARGDKGIDGRTDIYSLGASLYHLLTGQTPFQATTALAILNKHLNEQLSNPQDIVEEIPDGVVHIIQKMMAKSPDDRYADCAELISDLELAIQGKPPVTQALDSGLSSIAIRGKPGGGQVRGVKQRQADAFAPTMRSIPGGKKGGRKTAHEDHAEAGDKKKSSAGNPVMLYAGIGGAAVILIAVFMLMGGKGKPDSNADANRATSTPVVDATQNSKVAATEPPKVAQGTQTVAQTVAAPVATIPADAVQYQGHSYKIFMKSTPFTDAKERCEEMGGHLAYLETDQEYEFVKTMLKGLPDNTPLFLGATDSEREGEWRWLNGKPVTHTPPWAVNQPNGGIRENCLVIWALSGRWSDADGKPAPAGMLGGYVCEWETAKVASNVTANRPAKVPADAFEYQGHWYKLVYDPANKKSISWLDAKKRCEEMGGYLACIESSDENSFIAQHMQSLDSETFVFIGAMRAAGTTNWIWINSHPMQFTKWNRDGESKIAQGIAAGALTSRAGYWGAMAQDWVTNGFICEWEPSQPVAASKPDSSADSPERWKNAINLLPLIDVQQDMVSGDWRIENGILAGENKDFAARMSLPYQPPEEYDFRVSFTRMRGSQSVAQYVVKASRNVTWQMGGFGNKAWGFETIKGAMGNKNPTTVLSGLENGRRYETVIKVRKDRLQVIVDGKQAAEHMTDGSDLGVWGAWQFPDSTRLGVGCQQPTQFHSIEVLEVTGKGKVMRTPGAIATKTPDTRSTTPFTVAEPASQPVELIDQPGTTILLPAGFKYESVMDVQQPMEIEIGPHGHRLWVSTKSGTIWAYSFKAKQATQIAKINTEAMGQRGLHGIACHSDFANNGYLYVFYTFSADKKVFTNRVSRFTVSQNGNGNEFVPDSEKVLVEIPSTITDHQGGAIKYNPVDKKLYISTGDGNMVQNFDKIFGDSRNQALDLNDLRGKVLRLELDGSIPKDNPFAGKPGIRGEIFSYGHRNPFSMNIDSAGRVYVGEVGHDRPQDYEEINLLKAGGNFGWPLRLGPASGAVKGTSTLTDLIDPWLYYPRGGGASITSGPVYKINNGEFAFPARYHNGMFYADYTRKWVHFARIDPVTNAVTGTESFAINFRGGPISMLQGPDGALYIVEHPSKISRIIYKP